MKKSLELLEKESDPRSRTFSIYWNDKGRNKKSYAPPPLPERCYDSITRLRMVICRSYINVLANFKDRAVNG